MKSNDDIKGRRRGAMGTVVTVMNMKGGVGKTTVCLNLGGILSRYPIDGDYKRVLFIDYDPQFNLSQATLRSPQYFKLEKAGNTSLRILQNAHQSIDPYSIQKPDSPEPPAPSTITVPLVSRRTGETLDIVPSTLDLMYIALGSATGDTTVIETRWAKFIAECRKLYDLIMIDCHPAGSLLTKTALANSNHVLIPVVPQAFAARGVALMRRFVDASTTSPKKPELHILFNMLPRSGPTPPVVGEIRRDRSLRKLCLDHTLIKYSAFAEPNGGEGFVWWSSKPYSTHAFQNLDAVSSEFARRIDL